MNVGVPQNAQIACSFLVNHGPGALAACCIGAESAMMLTKGGGEVSVTDCAVRLFFVKLFALDFDI
jgi:hypothetical protein